MEFYCLNKIMKTIYTSYSLQVYLPGLPTKVGCDTRLFLRGEHHTHTYVALHMGQELAQSPLTNVMLMLILHWPPPLLVQWGRCSCRVGIPRTGHLAPSKIRTFYSRFGQKWTHMPAFRSLSMTFHMEYSITVK